MKNVVIYSNGPGLPEIVKEYGHSSDWIPNIVNNNKVNFIIKKAYENDFDSGVSAYIDTVIAITSEDMSFFVENIDSGNYAVSVFHDADQSGDITFGGFLNLIPQEGFGFSNNPNIGISQPSYHDCSFDIDEGQTILVPINLVYL